MKYINRYNYALIKRRYLKLLLKQNGIKRVNKNSLNSLENFLEEEVLKIMPLLKERLTINIKKTLEEKDVLSVVESLKKDKNYWEI